VGKSTLFNRLTGSRRSIVGDEPGITRDRIYGEYEWMGRDFRLVDTGGMVPDDTALIPSEIYAQAQVALEEADALVPVSYTHLPADLSPKRLWLVLHKIRCFQPAPCAMANMKHFNPLLLLQHTVDHTIDVELVPVEKMAEPSILGRQRAAVGHFFKAENLSLIHISSPCRCGCR